jgi:hypothetical protein
MPSLPGKLSIALCVARAARPSVPVEIEPGRHPAFGAMGHAVRVGRAPRLDQRSQRGQRVAIEVIIEPGQQDDVRLRPAR